MGPGRCCFHGTSYGASSKAVPEPDFSHLTHLGLDVPVLVTSQALFSF